MATRENISGIGFFSSYGPAAPTTSQTGNLVDTSNFDSVTLIADIGVGGVAFDPTNVNIAIKWETSDDGATWSGVSQGDILASYGTTVTVGTGGIVRTVTATKAAADVQPLKLAYAGGARYHRASPVLTGSQATGTPIYLGFVLAHAHMKPVA